MSLLSPAMAGVSAEGSASVPAMSASGGIPGTQTLRDGLAVVSAVATGANDLSQVVAATTLSRSKTHRLTQALREARYLRTDDRGKLLLGPALIELGFQALDQTPLVPVTTPILRKLSESVGDTVHLAVEDNGAALYLAKLHGARGVEIRSSVGGRRSLSRTGIGRALLLDAADRWEDQYVADNRAASQSSEAQDVAKFTAKMKTFQKLGCARDLEENEPGIRCVAAPIRDGSGSIIAAISISSTVMYMGEERMDELCYSVKKAASEASMQFGYKGSNVPGQEII